MLAVYTPELADQLANQILAMLIEDIAWDVIPFDVPDWTSLHDHVDANEYLLQTGFEWHANEYCIAFSAEVELEAFRRLVTWRDELAAEIG